MTIQFVLDVLVWRGQRDLVKKGAITHTDKICKSVEIQIESPAMKLVNRHLSQAFSTPPRCWI